MALGKNVFAIAIRNETETEAEWECTEVMGLMNKRRTICTLLKCE